MTRWLTVLLPMAALTVLLAGCEEADSRPLAQVYMTEHCACCRDWVNYLEEEAFEVEAHYVDQRQLNDLKREAGLDFNLSSCHSAHIEGYFVEGHVPAEDIRRMLAEQPDITGITVPGMPIGSPGMERGDQQDEYRVIAFDDQGNREVFAEHP